MTDKEKLEKIKSLADKMYSRMAYLTSDTRPIREAMEEYHQFIINEYHKEEPTIPDIVDEHFHEMLGEEPVSEDVWESSKRYALLQVLASTDAEMTEQAYLSLKLFSGFEIAVAHKDGAYWQKQQMMKDAVDAYIRRNRYIKKNVLNGLDVTCDKIQRFRDGDKNKVIFIKED